MKRFIAVTAVSFAALAGAASAMTLDADAVVRQINKFAPDVNVHQLSDQQIASVMNIINTGDESGKAAAVRAYLN